MPRKKKTPNPAAQAMAELRHRSLSPARRRAIAKKASDAAAKKRAEKKALDT